MLLFTIFRILTFILNLTIYKYTKESKEDRKAFERWKQSVLLNILGQILMLYFVLQMVNFFRSLNYGWYSWQLLNSLAYPRLTSQCYRGILFKNRDCVKSVHIWSYSSPYFPAFGLNTERHGVSLRFQWKCGKIWARITPNTDTFHTVRNFSFYHFTWGSASKGCLFSPTEFAIIFDGEKYYGGRLEANWSIVTKIYYKMQFYE